MLELGESPKAVAEPLGIPVARVREIQRSTHVKVVDRTSAEGKA